MLTGIIWFSNYKLFKCVPELSFFFEFVKTHLGFTTKFILEKNNNDGANFQSITASLRMGPLKFSSNTRAIFKNQY